MRTLTHVDPSRAQLAVAVPCAPGVARRFLLADEEQLPLGVSGDDGVVHGSVDLVVSCLGLHWLNDLPGAMVQSRHALRPDGLFLSAFRAGAFPRACLRPRLALTRPGAVAR